MALTGCWQELPKDSWRDIHARFHKTLAQLFEEAWLPCEHLFIIQEQLESRLGRLLEEYPGIDSPQEFSQSLQDSASLFSHNRHIISEVKVLCTLNYNGDDTWGDGSIAFKERLVELLREYTHG